MADWHTLSLAIMCDIAVVKCVKSDDGRLYRHTTDRMTDGSTATYIRHSHSTVHIRLCQMIRQMTVNKTAVSKVWNRVQDCNEVCCWFVTGCDT